MSVIECRASRKPVKSPLHTLPSWLEPAQPRLALAELVEQVNSIYHSFEAASYDSEIIEMRSLWPPLWRDMLAELPAVYHWRILDFGCGTGFASEQALSILGEKVSVLTAYDPSTQMLNKACAKLAGQRIIIANEESAIWQRAPSGELKVNCCAV